MTNWSVVRRLHFFTIFWEELVVKNDVFYNKNDTGKHLERCFLCFFNINFAILTFDSEEYIDIERYYFLIFFK